MSTPINKVYAADLFIDSGHKIELLRLQPKSSGFVAYLPRVVSEALGLRRDDHALIAFIDDSSSYTTLIIFKDRDLLSLLKSEILSRRQQAEQMRQQLKSQLQPQEEVKQGDFVVDVGVEK